MKIKLRKAYLGYISDDSIKKIDESTPLNSWVFLVCEINRFHFTRLFKHEHECFDFFPGIEDKKIKGGKFWWSDVMGFTVGGEIIWCVQDIANNDDRVYLFHDWKGVVYHLGRVHQGHDLEAACNKKFDIWKKSNESTLKS